MKQTWQPSKKWQSRSVPEVVCLEIYAGYQSRAVWYHGSVAWQRDKPEETVKVLVWPPELAAEHSVIFSCDPACKVYYPALLSLGRTVTVLWLPWGLDAPSPLQCSKMNWIYIWTEMYSRTTMKLVFKRWQSAISTRMLIALAPVSKERVGANQQSVIDVYLHIWKSSIPSQS